MRKTLFTILQLIIVAGLSLQNVSQSSAIQPSGVEETKFEDTFDNANNSSGDYGLNDSLSSRQSGYEATNSYQRYSGLWNSSTIPAAWYNQVNHPSQPNKLSFHVGNSALRLSNTLRRDRLDVFRISATVDPKVGDTTSGDWVSLMLSDSTSTNGYVTDSGMDVGLLIRSNGQIQVFSNGAGKSVNMPTSIPSSNTYEVNIAVSNSKIQGTINGYWFDAPINAINSNYEYLYVGKSGTGVSTIDNLSSDKESTLKNYGYYWSNSTSYGNHLDEVAHYSNFNFIQNSGDNSTFEDCESGECLLETRWICFDGYNNYRGDTSCKDGLTSKKNNLDSNNLLEKLGGIHTIDEPFHRDVSVADYSSSVEMIKDVFPNLPVITAFAYTEVTTSMVLPTQIDSSPDLISVGYYTEIDKVAEKVRILESKMGSHQSLFLVPQSYCGEGTPLSGCDSNDSAVSASDDNAVASINYDYYNLARMNEKVIALLNFGAWSHQPNNGLRYVNYYPETARAQRKIAGEIFGWQFVDSFDAYSTQSSTGLNEWLDGRQFGWLNYPSTYSQKSGHWSSSTPPSVWAAQVNQPSYPDQLSLHLGTSAVMQNKAMRPTVENVYDISVSVDPVVNNTTSSDWSSIMIGSSNTSKGYVTNTDIPVGLLIRSNGSVSLFSRGTSVSLSNSSFTPNPDGSFDVKIVVNPNTRSVNGTINGTDFSGTLPTNAALSNVLAYIYLGNYSSSSSNQPASTFDNLIVAGY